MCFKLVGDEVAVAHTECGIGRGDVERALVACISLVAGEAARGTEYFGWRLEDPLALADAKEKTDVVFHGVLHTALGERRLD